MKKKELFELESKLSNGILDTVGTSLAYVISKNLKSIKEECNLMREVISKNEKYIEYETKLQLLKNGQKVDIELMDYKDAVEEIGKYLNEEIEFKLTKCSCEKTEGLTKGQIDLIIDLIE